MASINQARHFVAKRQFQTKLQFQVINIFKFDIFFFSFSVFLFYIKAEFLGCNTACSMPQPVADKVKVVRGTKDKVKLKSEAKFHCRDPVEILPKLRYEFSTRA